jgi:hypothetical protein
MSIPLHDRIYRVILARTLLSSVNIWLVLSIFLLIGCLFPVHADESKTIKLTDPVYPDKPKKEHTLNVHFDTQGFPSGYSMELINKVCLDDVCKLVEVTMYWDVIGFYQSLEYPEGKPLTKVEHEPFTPEDYDKLDSILKDRESILDNHELGFLATENDDKSSEEGYTEGQDSDGVSKATPGAVKEAVVKDAAWTTWVLWKYANTELVTIMQEMTKSRISPKFLQQLLDSKNWQKIEFVLKHLLEKKPVAPQYIDKVAEVMPSAGIDHVELAIEYLKQASPDKSTCYQKLINSMVELDEYSAALVIELLEADDQLEERIIEQFTSSLVNQEYYPIHLGLRLIESREFFSKSIETDIVKLLHNQDFFIARRASDFLSNQQLSVSAKVELDSFKARYADRL